MAVNQQQLDYLSAMGIPVWISRDLPLPDLSEPADRRLGFDVDLIGKQLSDETNKSEIVLPRRDVKAKPATTPPVKGLQAANALIKDLQQKPIKQIAELAASLDEPIIAKPQPVYTNLEGVDWIALEKAVRHCTACDLHAKRQQTVFGQGCQQPRLMVVGDIPRLSDEQKNQPFTGEAGELLSNLLNHLEVGIDTVYFTNLLKCRTPLDNSPQPNQAASCLSYLKQQIKLLQPKLVLLMGRSTAQQVLGQEIPMAQLRQKRHPLEALDCEAIVTYHPAYLLRQPRLKGLVWQDLQFIQQVLTSHG